MSVLDLTGRGHIGESQLKKLLRDNLSAESVRVKYDDFDDHYAHFLGTVMRLHDDAVVRHYYFSSPSRNRYVPFEFVE